MGEPHGATGCGVVKSHLYPAVGLGGVPCGETRSLGDPLPVPSSTCFLSRGELVAHPSTPQTLDSTC